ncbi:hypothetical protein SeMB42_g02914 [Synchytrium endobioticum]|uniref:Uncharacterized protein n=1 Tax=Synchytrium endobioticum TaxID=286115 RepID=A0A507DBJ1_9FUNG|nr:hypothetical protein SeMB42_g02914 [Synchytrium endobioticum]
MEALKAQAKPPLRTLVLNGDWFVGSVLATTLTKLTLRYASICKHKENVNKLRCEAMLIMTSIIRVGRSEFPSSPIDEDSHDRIMACLRLLSSITDEDSHLTSWLITCREWNQLLDQIHSSELLSCDLS